MDNLKTDLKACQLCADRFAVTKTMHRPRPVVWFQSTAKILIAGQAPGMRVHQSGIPFDDRSGDRLRDWMGIAREQFYDQTQIAIVPMAFCFPGYDAKGSDRPPPKICSVTWRDQVMAMLPNIQTTLLIGGYAQNWHFNTKAPVATHVNAWRDHAPHLYPLPHPSWRNNAYLRKHPVIDAELLPHLKQTIAKALT
ncbi:MAG: uracil-DNA glycosylase family protein [Planktomarina sp.]